MPGLVLALGLVLLLVLDFVGWFLSSFGRASVVSFGLGFCSGIVHSVAAFVVCYGYVHNLCGFDGVCLWGMVLSGV